MTAPVVGLLLGVGLALLLAALLAAGRAAAPALGRDRIERYRDSGRPAARRAAEIAEHPARVIRGAGGVQVGLEVLAVIAVTLAVVTTGWPWWQSGLFAWGGAVVALAGLTRALPHRIGTRHPGGTLLVTGALLRASSALLRPTAEDRAADALRDMVEQASSADLLEREDREMMRSVLELGDTIVREVMVPRTEMVTVPGDTPLRKALGLFLRSGFSRVPVTGESVDDLIGVLYLKDVVRRRYGVPDSDALPVSEIVRPAEFVPESKPVDDLLRAMQAGSFHMAMVVDEFGGIAGLVTVEDALEEIVGELTDEHDRAAPEVEDLGDGRFRIPAHLPLDDLGDLFGLEIEDDDVDTAAGLLAKALGKVPLTGSGVAVAGLELTAERTEGRRRRLTTLIAARERPEAEPETGAHR